MPLVAKKLSIKPLIDKVKGKALDWKNNTLSYAGRLPLISSVLASMHTYWVVVFLLLKTVAKDIERVVKSLLWNQSLSGRGKAKVSWHNMCYPKSEG